MHPPKRFKERRSISERTFLEIMVILAGLLIGELVWIVLFTFVALWLRRL